MKRRRWSKPRLTSEEMAAAISLYEPLAPEAAVSTSHEEKEEHDMKPKNGLTVPATVPNTPPPLPAPIPEPAPTQALAAIPVPRGLDTIFTPEAWGAMTPADRDDAIAFFQTEDAATTEGLAVTFPRWKFPTSGGTRFILDTEDPEAPELKEIAGVVVAKIPGRGYYEPGQAAAKGTPPLCASADGVAPDVSPSPASGAKTCAACPFSQWGSGKDGQGHATRGQACKYRIRAFFLRDSNAVPEYISLPPTAGKPFAQYAVALKQLRLPMIAVETIFGLSKQVSGQGVEFSGLTLKVGRRLSFPEMRTARAIADQFEAHMRRTGLAVEETEGDDHGGNGHGEVLDAEGTVVATTPDPDDRAGF